MRPDSLLGISMIRGCEETVITDEDEGHYSQRKHYEAYGQLSVAFLADAIIGQCYDVERDAEPHKP